MLFRSESVPKVYKIFGPGNQYVTAAKQLVSLRDVFIGICESYDWNGCYIERKTAERYGVKMHTIFAEDIINNYDKYVEEVSGKITSSSLELKSCSCSTESYL